MRQGTPYLTKSRFLNGLACEKYLWLDWHEQAPFEEPQPGSPAAIGIEIGQHAHALFPGGRLVHAEPWEYESAVIETQLLMNDASVPAIFEAAFEANNIHVRVDILERLDGNQWGLREVKSSTSVKEDHIPDVAIQLNVLRNAGIDVKSAELIHINKDYVLDGDSIDWSRYFSRVELINDAEAILPDIDTSIAGQFAILNRSQMPNIAAGKHCPDHCPYWDDCTFTKPRDWIYQLPRISKDQFEDLQSHGIEAISRIPEDYPLNQQQSRVRDVVQTGEPYLSDDLPNDLQALSPPTLYLDFETMAPPIPLYEGTSPYGNIPFQWSLHSLDDNGKLDHQEFLADTNSDPRRAFCETLIAALGNTSAPIVVYSGFEKRVLNSMAKLYPDLANELSDIISGLADLLVIVRNNIYFEEFRGSFSIKNVGPALVEDFTYEDLSDIKDGAAAASAYWRMCVGQIPVSEQPIIRNALLEYCENDTLAMVQVHKALMALAQNEAAN